MDCNCENPIYKREHLQSGFFQIEKSGPFKLVKVVERCPILHLLYPSKIYPLPILFLSFLNVGISLKFGDITLMLYCL